MKPLLSVLVFFLFTQLSVSAQTGRVVRGTVLDSTKLSLPGTSVKIVPDKGDSSITVADVNGKFVFNAVSGTKFTLTVSSIGYIGLKRRYTFDNGTGPVILDPIVLKAQSNLLGQVNITAAPNAVIIKEDTIEYKAAAFPVREGAPVEDILKKVPGVDVDLTTGAVTAQGQAVTKVRLNGKDYFGGDVTSLTKNLPADVVDGIQIIDDYGDAANITGIKSGTPTKVLNITIRKDKNFGYFVQATGGDGEDALPKAPNVTDDNRYVGLLNVFDFNGDRQISLLGGLNNTNVNTFNFGSTGGGGGGAGGNFGGGGGGGRGNAARGSGSTTSTNGITNARSLGTNFRDQWGKNLSVYGSYSFADNTTFTNSTSQQTNTSPTNPSVYNEHSLETDNVINHRVTWNMEYKPDTLNYLKVTPTFSYSKTTTAETDNVASSRNNIANSAYTSNSPAATTAPNFGFTALYNHKFKHRRNLSITGTFSSSKNDQYQNPTYNYTVGLPTAPVQQQITVNSRTTSAGGNLSYLEPIGKISYLEFNYAYNYSHTSTDRSTLAIDTNSGIFLPDTLLSSNYSFNFITNRVGLNYRVIAPKYNLTLGVGVLPTELDGFNPATGLTTHTSTFNFSPSARYVYNFSRSNSLNISYSGNAGQPTYNELLPKIDYSNALYPVEGNPGLKPSYSNSVTIRYNKFSFATGNVLFSNLTFTQTDNNIATNIITYPTHFAASVLAVNPTLKNLQNTYLTTYSNVSGYYSANGFVTYSKPWDNRKYTLTLNGSISYTNNVAYVGSVDSLNNQTLQKNVAKTLSLTPKLIFRTDLLNIIDAQVYGSYAVNKTDNSIRNTITNSSSDVRTTEIGVNGKNYFFKDWTLSYDLKRDVNYGYTVPVTNPNILNAYLERRFLKNNAATIRFAVYDIFNQNAGYTYTATGTSTTESSVNRLGRYYLATFTLRLQKFAGKSPFQNGGQGGRRTPGGGAGGPGGPYEE